jgi:hypothetical protein
VFFVDFWKTCDTLQNCSKKEEIIKTGVCLKIVFINDFKSKKGGEKNKPKYQLT